MARLIKDRAIVDDQWELLRDPVDAEALRALSGRNVILPLSSWLELRETLPAHQGLVGVWLKNTELPEAIAPWLAQIPLIALDFPVFTDGRAYSSARELRQNFGYEGEVRAIGDVLCDQLFYMSRCGFNAFAMRADQNLEAAIHRFEDFKDAYQASVHSPEPLFRRRSCANG
jgi:uncharacterized protein (DUF934 family)